MHGNPPEPPEMSRIELEDHYETQLHNLETQLSDIAAAYEATLEALPMWRLIVAEQARARRLHPDDHAGHPNNTWQRNFRILDSEMIEVHTDIRGSTINLIWELIQVAGVAAAWAERLMADADINTDDILQLIEGTEQ